MNNISKLYLSRAENELIAGRILNDVSLNPLIQKEQFKIETSFTFYSSVISHCYYCIFNTAKAILINEGIKTDMPNVHKKTFQAFKKFLVKTGKLDKSLFKIYEDMVVRADVLLDIFSLEKGKRGEFTYKTLPQANVEPAKQSLENADLFFKTINKILEESQN
ncbi:MAG: hypothetical protein WC979_05290 [Candidatus Pacearchaeota archaeon]|jgi:uncharacterized protein (UPF0332 family)